MRTRKGIVLAGGSGTRLWPITRSVTKQLLPIYDKPMIYYPLSVLMLAGLKEVLIISTPEDQPLFERLFGSGAQLGMSISYAVQPSPDGLAQAFLIAEHYLDGYPSCLVLGDNLFYGQDLPRLLDDAYTRPSGATIFGYRVSDPTNYGIVAFDERFNVLSLEEKPMKPKSNWAVPGLYFYDEHVVELARTLKPSPRGELEITDLNRIYLERNDLQIRLFGRGMAWLDTGNCDALLEASQFVQAIQHRQGLKIACVEEIAFRKEWIDDVQMLKLATGYGKTSYAHYLRQLVHEKEEGAMFNPKL